MLLIKMETIWIILAIVGLLALGAGIFTLLTRRKKSDGKYPEGHYIGIGIAIGVAIGLALDNLAIGIGVGAGIGIAMEAKAKKEGKIRPMTKEEKRRQKWFLLIGLLMFILGIIAYFVVRK